jgi:hypothetical protein
MSARRVTPKPTQRLGDAFEPEEEHGALRNHAAVASIRSAAALILL